MSLSFEINKNSNLKITDNKNVICICKSYYFDDVYFDIFKTEMRIQDDSFSKRISLYWKNDKNDFVI